jgi:hypothetical protein
MRRRLSTSPQALRRYETMTKSGSPQSWVARLPLVWQWLLVFAITCVLLVSRQRRPPSELLRMGLELKLAPSNCLQRHWKWLTMSAPLDQQAAARRGQGSRVGLLPGHDPPLTASSSEGRGSARVQTGIPTYKQVVGEDPGGGSEAVEKEMGAVQADWRVGGGAGNRVTVKAATPPRKCPVSVPWDKMPRDPGKKRAAVFTPYNIVSV